MDAVKLEGGREMAHTIRAITNAGITVIAHIGLTPQSAAKLGGYRVQGKTAHDAQRLLDDALAVQEAGAAMIVLEMVPDRVAERGSPGSCGFRPSASAREWNATVRCWCCTICSGYSIASRPNSPSGMPNCSRRWSVRFQHTGRRSLLDSSPRANNLSRSRTPNGAPGWATHLAPLPLSRTGTASWSGVEADMRIAVLGTGALGCIYAARLAAHADVCMLGSWADGVSAIRAGGINVRRTGWPAVACAGARLHGPRGSRRCRCGASARQKLSDPARRQSGPATCSLRAVWP